MPEVKLDISDILYRRLTEQAALIGASVEGYTIQTLLRGLSVIQIILFAGQRYLKRFASAQSFCLSIP
jgi:hypothetical protein